jgi:hypothetical protein
MTEPSAARDGAFLLVIKGICLVRFRAPTLAFLIGLVLGSFYVLWPFKDIDAGASVTGRDGEEKTEVRIATAPNRLPESGTEAATCGLALLVGFGAAWGVERLGRRRGGESDTAASDEAGSGAASRRAPPAERSAPDDDPAG